VEATVRVHIVSDGMGNGTQVTDEHGCEIPVTRVDIDPITQNCLVTAALHASRVRLDIVADARWAPAWTPASERLPDMDERVLVCRGSLVQEAWRLGAWWTNGASRWDQVDCWMPLPPGPGGG
jgi:hypothetical protein